ncbi:cupin domain-containing protein [Roseomonas marmotae]|nr:cupin domain-containing protein [Roseomonas marmotae]
MTERVAIRADTAPQRGISSSYPAVFAARMAGRVKRPLGDLFGLRNFGVNLTVLEPGAVSALHHAHSQQDEFVFILEGEAVLVSGEEEVVVLRAGYCAGFPAGGAAHHLENRSAGPVRYLEVGDRTEGDGVVYPLDDLLALREDGRWRYRHKDGPPY